MNKDYFQSFMHISAQFTKRSVLNYVHYEWVGMNIVMALHVCVVCLALPVYLTHIEWNYLLAA